MTHLGQCASETSATLMLKWFFCKEEKETEGRIAKVYGRKWKEIIQLRFIGDIQFIDAFFASQQCNSRVFGTGSVGMSVIYKQHDRRNTMATKQRMWRWCILEMQ
jgi:hypothetical protein